MHVRCKRCRARRTLNRAPDHYFILPRCRSCGKRAGYNVDHWRRLHERGKPPCRCQWYHHPHRRGSGLCMHNPKVDEAYMRERGFDPQPIAAEA